MNKYLIIAIFTVFICKANAQIVSNDIVLTKASTVYIIMSDTTSKVSKSYMEVYNKYWTFSKINFISPEEKEALTKSGNFFFGFDFTGSNFVELQLYRYVKNNEGNYYKEVDLEIVGFVRHRGYFDTILNESKEDVISGIERISYDMEGNLMSWGPGVLKNYIQKIGYLTAKNRKNLEDVSKYYKYVTKIDNGEMMGLLRTSDLYITESCLKQYSKMYNYYTDQPKDAEKLLKNYSFSYEVVSDKELNKKILESQTEFFYCLFYPINGTKCVNIVSSKTGKIVYSTINLNVYEFNEKDIKRIVKTIRAM